MSLALAYHPELVVCDQEGRLLAAGKLAKTRFEALGRGRLSITRRPHLGTINASAGNPQPTVAEPECRLRQMPIDRLPVFPVGLSAADADAQPPS